MPLPFLDAREVRICPIATRRYCLSKAAFLLTTVPPRSPSDSRAPSANFWAVFQAESARNATTRRRFPRSAEPTANNPVENRTEVQDPWRNQRPFPAKPPRTRGGATAGRAAVTASADESANRSIERNAPPSPVHPYRERRTSSQRRRRWQTSRNLPWSENVRDKHGPCRGTC